MFEKIRARLQSQSWLPKFRPSALDQMLTEVPQQLHVICRVCGFAPSVDAVDEHVCPTHGVLDVDLADGLTRRTIRASPERRT